MAKPVDPFPMSVMRELLTNHELVARESTRPKIDPAQGAHRIAIVGGGTAGWCTALALRAQLPSLQVTVLESSSIPIIGVGEATVPTFVSFLHHYLKLDVVDFYKEVRPTWKQGIRFEWGMPGNYVFQAPFDWEANGIGMLGSMAETGNVSAFTLQAALMAKDVVPIVNVGGQLRSYLPILSFAYHLDNPRLVRYLTKTALARGVKHLDVKIVDATTAANPAPDGDPLVEHLVTEDGQKLDFDLYVDCTGFRSLLLEKAQGATFHSYASSLLTDAALAFNAPHDGKLKPYTTARTMDHGWCWNIPMIDDDHLGYVFASSHCSEDEALAEARRLWPGLTHERIVRFRSGRHDRAWIGNVFAVGNAYAFVEPLESTGLLMITRAISHLVRSFPIGPDSTVAKRFVNGALGRDWDRLRWFLAAHYKFNKRLDTKFWTDVRETVDVSGIADALAMFQKMGPLSLLPRAIRTNVNDTCEIFFYGLAGLDNILLGQKVPHPTLEREPPAVWRARRQKAVEFTRAALPQAEALKAVAQNSMWLREMVEHPAGWVARSAVYI